MISPPSTYIVQKTECNYEPNHDWVFNALINCLEQYIGTYIESDSEKQINFQLNRIILGSLYRGVIPQDLEESALRTRAFITPSASTISLSTTPRFEKWLKSGIVEPELPEHMLSSALEELEKSQNEVQETFQEVKLPWYKRLFRSFK